MAIKDRMKEARLNKKMTQEQLAAKVGIAKSTLAGYETGIREPSIETLGRIMIALDIDANYLWQDETDFPIKVSYNEMQHIKKYRDLDDHGTDMVDTVLSKEWERSKAEKEKEQSQQISQPAPVSIAPEAEPEHLRVQAAHAIDGASEEDNQHDDDLMNNDDLWK